MHVTTFMILRELISVLERNHDQLRRWWSDDDERQRFDRLARLTIHRACAAVDLYEEDPLPERMAIGAMYAACDAGLRLLEVMAQVPAEGPDRKTRHRAIRDLRRLITELFDWVVVPNGEPVLEIAS